MLVPNLELLNQWSITCVQSKINLRKLTGVPAAAAPGGVKTQ
jgi:hypothetical protein